jgi:hypothetical protein
MRFLRIPDHGIGLALLGLASLALIVAGCGGNAKAPSVARIATSTSASTGVTSTASAMTTTPTHSPIQRLIAYSLCMRRNGVLNFPDPDSKGNLVITPNDNINPTSPQYERAQNACKRLSPESANGEGMTPHQHAQALAFLTRYVECMREHAIPMANPFNGPNGGVGIILPRGVDPNSQQYKHADAACKHFLPNAG